MASISLGEGSEETKFYFEASFIEHEEDSEYEYCFYGFIKSYTIPGTEAEAEDEETEEAETVIGYGNPELAVQPVFKLEKNGETDFRITVNKDLDEDWREIIEMACKEFSPTTTIDESEDTGSRRLQVEEEDDGEGDGEG